MKVIDPQEISQVWQQAMDNPKILTQRIKGAKEALAIYFYQKGLDDAIAQLNS